jgi:hypothetical protein
MSRRPVVVAAVAVLLLAACASTPRPVASVASTEPAPVAGEGSFVPYGPEVAARFPAPPLRYLTPGLAPGRSTFTSNDELAAELWALARAPAPGVVATLLQPGRSQRGVPLLALRLSGANGAPARPTVLLVGQQHGDEPAPAEALLVVAKELAQGSLRPLLERIDVVVMPRANPDGAVPGRRVAADGIDLNRDHLLLRSPEARALATLMREQRAAVVVDAHEYSVIGRWLAKFGALQRFDVLLQAATVPNLPPRVAAFAETRFRAPLADALRREGLAAEWYYTTSADPADKRVSMGGTRPDIGRNVNGLKHAVSLLVETRGVGIGRLHLMRRVHTHVVAARDVLQRTAAEAEALLQMQRNADAEVAGQACRGELAIDAEPVLQRRALTLLDPDTGADRVVDVEWASAIETRVTETRARPCGYWLGALAADAAERLRLLGVQVQRFDAEQALQVERWRQTAAREGARADVRGRIDDAGASVRHVDVALDRGTLAAPAGSWYVSMAQPLAHLVAAALEPDTQNSYYANRIVDALDDVARVVVPPPPR